MLSTARAEATRRALAENGIAATRFARIEGVANREPFAPDNLYDPRNRRMSITLAWSRSAPRHLPGSVMLRNEASEKTKEAPGRHKTLPPAQKAELGSTALRSEEHTSELQSLMRISYAVFCLKKKNNQNQHNQY